MRTIHARFPVSMCFLLDEAGQPLMPREWRSADARELFHNVSTAGLASLAGVGRVDAVPGETLPAW